MRLLHGLDLGVGLRHPIELAGVVERLLLRPHAAQHGEVLVGAPVACVVVEPVAVLGLVGVAPAGDDVEREAAVGELVERGGLPRGQRRRDEARAVRDQVGQALGVGGGVARHHEALGGGGGVAHQHLVEARRLVGAREVADPRAVDLAADHVHGGAVGSLRPHPDHPDELDGHARLRCRYAIPRLAVLQASPARPLLPAMCSAMYSASSPTPQSTEDLSFQSHGRPRK